MLMDISGAQDWHLTFSSVHEDLILVLPRAFGSIVLALLFSALSTAVYFFSNVSTFLFIQERSLLSCALLFQYERCVEFSMPIPLYIQSIGIFYEISLYLRHLLCFSFNLPVDSAKDFLVR